MNIYALTDLQRMIAEQISDKLGHEVQVGRYVDITDSYHIYGKDIETAKQMLFDRIDSMSFEERIYNFNDEFIQEMYQSAEDGVLEKIKNLSNKE